MVPLCSYKEYNLDRVLVCIIHFLHMIWHLVLTLNLKVQYCYLHFTNEKKISPENFKKLIAIIYLVCFTFGI